MIHADCWTDNGALVVVDADDIGNIESALTITIRYDENTGVAATSSGVVLTQVTLVTV
jgi:hypothetical protein